MQAMTQNNSETSVGISLAKLSCSLFSKDENTQYTISEIVFFVKLIDGRKDIYIYNSSVYNHYVATLAKDGADSSKGDIIYLRPMEYYPVTDWFSEKNYPNTNVEISFSYNDSETDSNNFTSMINLSFNKLEMNGKPVVLGGFTIHAKNSFNGTGIQIDCRHKNGLEDLKVCYLKNENGISLNSSEAIKPIQTKNSDETKFYPIDYTAHGFQNGDKFFGFVKIALSDKNILIENCKNSIYSEHSEIIKMIK